MSRSLVLLALLLASLAGPAHLAAQDVAPESDSPRVLVGLEADVFFAVSAPHLDRYLPGPSLSASVQFSVTKWLMPLFRLRGGLLTEGPNTRDLGTLGSALAGIRFRPRGIAHPEEVPRATCIWAEVDAGIALWNGLPRPTFEAAIGFTFEAGEFGLGPVVRLQHVFPTEPSDGPDAFLMTVGLELLFGDARQP